MAPEAVEEAPGRPAEQPQREQIGADSLWQSGNTKRNAAAPSGFPLGEL
jgi:hypothetical protein